jgi:hypothetical protein
MGKFRIHALELQRRIGSPRLNMREHSIVLLLRRGLYPLIVPYRFNSPQLCCGSKENNFSDSIPRGSAARKIY